MHLRKRVYVLIGILLIVSLCFFGFKILNRPLIEFKETNPQLEINSKLDAISYIEKVRGYDIKDVKIDTKDVNTKKLGEYVIKYIVDDKEYNLKIKVVDTHAPELTVKNIDSEIGADIKADQFVNKIEDQTKVKIKFKKDYRFDKEGKQEVVIVAEDEAGNKTEKKAALELVKDTQKPELTGLSDMIVKVGSKTSFESGVKAKDNRDSHPKIDIDSSQVDLNKVGQYKVTYTVTDRAGNTNQYTRKVNVVEKVNPKKIEASDEKVIYLTFDDGPSENTKKILDVLDKYNAKATFFVTGNGKKYNKYIKEAHDRGHTIGLHTYTHNYKQVYSSVNAYFEDLDKVGQMVKEQIGYVPHYIRFPGGSSNTKSSHYCKGIMTTLVSEVQNRGYQYYDWNGDTTDASGNNVPVSQLIKNGTSSHSKNINILAHDTQAKSTTVEALPKIIEHYQKLGYEFRAIDDNSFTPHHHVNN